MQKANGELVSGGLAMVVGAYALTQNIGKIGELVQFVQDKEIYTGPDGEKYQHDGESCWIIVGEGLLGRVGDDEITDTFALHIPAHLMPINPEPDPLHVSEREKCQA